MLQPLLLNSHPACPSFQQQPLTHSTNPEQAWQGSRWQQLRWRQWLLHQQALLTPGGEAEWEGGTHSLLPSLVDTPTHPAPIL